MTISREDLLAAIGARAARTDEQIRIETHQEVELWFRTHIGIGELGEFSHALTTDDTGASVEIPDDCSAFVEGLPLHPSQALEVCRHTVRTIGGDGIDDVDEVMTYASLWTSDDGTPFREAETGTGTQINDLGDLATILHQLL